MAFDVQKLRRFPVDPGVYMMKGRQGAVLYVGKAKNLRQRIKQYFASSGDARPMVPFLVAKVESIETIVVSSEKEALLLENTLIKEHRPPYNAVFKDDKSTINIRVTAHQRWPMVQLVRSGDLHKKAGKHFGPYPSAMAARETFDILNRLFPLRQCSNRELMRRRRPCILYQMKRCLAPCVKFCTKEEYDQHVDRVIKFLQGRNQEVLRELHAKMNMYSEALEFERAAEVLKVIQSIEKTIEKQRVEVRGGGDVDVLGIFRQGDEVMLTVLYYRHGRLVGARNHSLSSIVDDDGALIKNFLMQHYEGGTMVPHEVLLPVKVPEAELIAEVLGFQMRAPQRGDKRAQVMMACRNAETAFYKDKDLASLREKNLLMMQEKLRLLRFPRRIECFDTSHLCGAEAVAAMVVFIDGEKSSKYYRKYKIKSAVGGDDYAMMQEVLQRRYRRAKEDNDFPDLIIIDGGRGHLNIARKVLSELDIANVDVVSLAKEKGRHDKGITAEKVFIPDVKNPVILRKHSPVLFLLQRVRDEAHRFALKFHRQRRSNSFKNH